ncbi:MAG: enoyl-CoA hydratase/isomerase family protein [Sterolibacteriaceae bacterium]|uniref:Enoyl-CoA hydratase/isomerase family protein n=1 Tax=Candidatus Methylophosphatis roskildensis TaxID=2899263 RepID=A0A9D7EAA6_9PROT|nr:enoyl-CoA hydratase/isomerase family protein [Candidatus Methylophosphatis roskildensis]
MNPYRNWSVRRDDERIAWITLDVADSPMNKLSADVMTELATVLDDIERYPPAAAVFLSGKEAGFVAGADIEEFAGLDSPDKARELVARGWDLFNRMAGLAYPTCALIRGHCLGGGLELALACRYRVVVDEPATRLALPEVMLGIVPGWGGMLRLPQMVGPAAALDMMLTGRSVDARKAKKLGLADECVPARVMHNAARATVMSGRPARELPFWQRLLNGPLKGVVARQARAQVEKRAPQKHYPAPYAILDMWARYGGNALAVPANKPTSLDAIVASPTTRNLVRVFFMQERLKGFGKEADFQARHVHVIGAGTMGGDIAAWCAGRGMTVTLQDQAIEQIAPAIRRAAKVFDRKCRGDKLKSRMMLERIVPDVDWRGVRQADVVIEAIFENLEAKHRLLMALEPMVKPDAVLATNTSSLRIEDIGAVLNNPTRLVGIHFFNPVAKMPLVEVVSAANTDPVMSRRAAAFVKQIDKLPLPVASHPGFLVNAVLGPYMLEAIRCVDEGFAPETIDRALTDFGMPMGPIELVDLVGLDVAVAAGAALTGAGTPPKRLSELVAAGNLGKKSGQGFYAWIDGKAQKGTAGAVPDGLTQRIIQPLLDATRRCVDQGVVADANLADAGVIFGTGFAPFTGGPMNYLGTRLAPARSSRVEAAPALPRAA